MEKINEKNSNISQEIKTFSDLMNLLKSNRLLLVVLTVFTLIVYANIITGDFVNLDDLSKSLEEPAFQDIMISIRSFDGYGILTTLIYKTFGINSSAFHIASIISHLINGILVFLLISMLFGKKAATLATFLFLSHPANTESVSWHAGYSYLLRTGIILPVLIFFTLFKKSGDKKYLFISSGIFLLGTIFLRTGGWILITPFLVVIMDQFIIEDKIKLKNIKEYVPFIIISLIFAAIFLPIFFSERVEGLETLHYVDVESATPLLNRIPYTIYMEYKTLFFPKDLSIYHEGAYISNLEYTLMIFVTALVLFGIGYFIKKNRAIAGLLMMIIFAILPSFSPIVIAWVAAERYLYIPTIFSSAIMALFLIWIESNINRKKPRGETTKFLIYAAIIIVSLFSVRTMMRNVDLRSSKNLWIATKKTAPYSYRVYNNMGDVYANEGDYEKAIENFKKSVALKPDYADAVHNIGHIYMQTQDFGRAKAYFSQSLEINPNLYPAAYKLGLISYYEEDFEAARKYFEQCLAVNPNDQDCLAGMEITKDK